MKKITHILYSFLKRVITPSLSVRVWGGSFLLLLLLSACTPHPTDVEKSEELPPIYPDYVDVTIPKNIAPLNFLVRGEMDAVEARVEPLARRSQGGERQIMINAKGNELCFSLDEWKELLQENAGKELKVTVSARDKQTGSWTEYRSFLWHVVEDEVDPYLSYRLIEPDYEVFSHLEIRERCVENFEERNLSTYKLVGNRCMNCHTHSVQKPNLSMMYVRGEGGGAILNENGVLRKLNIQSPTGGSVYFTFSPSGRYVCFSTNVIIPAFHARSEKRLEVYDDASDVYVFDLQEERVISSALVADSMVFETFPAFSPDGKSIYFCSAPRVSLPAQIADLQYSLCRIGFDERTGTFVENVDTIVRAEGEKGSVCHPRVSPDGRYLLYTVAAYGTFPIWHRESDQRLLDLQTGHVDSLVIVNSDMSDTYHSWSSNSRWFVFASKRDDGLYGKPYFCYIDKQGKAHKPFCLPQKYPSFYDHCLKSFNVPDLGSRKMNFTAEEVGKLF